MGRAHNAVFGAVRPAATLVVVAGLLDPEHLVEVELEAYLGDRLSRTGPVCVHGRTAAR